MTTKHNANQGRASESLLHSLAAELAAARAMPRSAMPPSTAQPKRKLSVYQKAAVRRVKARHQRAVAEFAQRERPRLAPLVSAGLSYRRMATVLNERGETYLKGRAWTDDTVRGVVKALGLR